MAETVNLIDTSIFTNQKLINNENPDGESPESLAPIDKSPFRRIEFQLAKKPFTGFTNGGGGGSFRLETLNPTTTSSKSNHQSVGLDSGKKRDASEMENGLDPELSLGITFKKIGPGLENLGNTCFLNSVLQCLTYTEPLAAYLQSGKHQVTCRKSGFCALCAIQKHVSRALHFPGKSLAPKDLVSNLRCISRTFRNSRQEDAHEYMVNLLESMHKCCLPNGVPSESQSAYDRSLVHKIFGGRLRSQVKCMQCNYCSNTFDPFLDLSLEILKADTLYKAFANFTAKEQLDGGAKQYQCQQCKQKVKALKQLTIHKAPNVLTLHLKRFGSHMSGQKIDKKIQFGSTLDLKSFVTGPYEGDLKYTLYGVLVHAGWSTHSGHYYCFVRTSSGMWYSLDDNRVSQVSEKKIFEQKAYMLFYFKDRKNFPSKKTTTDGVHQKENVINGTIIGPDASKEAQMKTRLSNGSLTSLPNGPVTLKEAQLKTGQSNRSLNGLPNGPVAPKEAQMKTGPSNPSLNSHNSLANFSTDISPIAPKETQTDTTLSNGSLDGLGNGAPEQSQKKDDPVPKSISESNSENSQKCKNEVFCVQTALTVSCSKPVVTPVDTASKPEKTSHVKETVKSATELPLLSNLPKTETSTEKKASRTKTSKKVKNFWKCKGISMKFSSKVLIGSSLNQKKKKKHKRVKNLAQENSVNKSSSPVKIEEHVAVKPPVENGFKEETTDFNVVSNGIRSELKEKNHLDGYKEASTQKDLVHMLTRGMDDRIIPCWDEDNSTPFQRRERTRDLKIGYIGDKWDEEYDRGKKKKVRMSQTEFDGKNPFQSIANERLKSHSAKQNLSKRPPSSITTKNNKFKKPRSGNNERFRT